MIRCKLCGETNREGIVRVGESQMLNHGVCEICIGTAQRAAKLFNAFFG